MTLTQAETGLFVLGSIGTVLLVVSVSSSYWRTSDRYHDGLFQGCFEVNSGGRTLTECGEIKGINDKSTGILAENYHSFL